MFSRGVAGAASLALVLAAWVGVPAAAQAASPLPIATIQGTGAYTPYAGRTVTTTPSQVTAVYGQTSSDFRGFVIQTPGTGGKHRNLRRASDAIFVYLGSTPFDVKIGDLVSVTGTAAEFPTSTASDIGGLTQIAGSVTVTKSSARYVPVEPVSGLSWRRTAAHRENLESMLFSSKEKFLVSDTYPLARYGELGLSSGRLPVQPTDVAPAGSAKAAAQAALNAASQVNLDDGSNVGFAATAKLPARTVPYLTRSHDVRIGSALTLDEPVIVDYRNGKWKFNPTHPTPAGDEVATIRAGKRESVPRTGGDLSVASYNVLNYFTTLGQGRPSCTGGNLDRTGSYNVTYNCDVRGAWDEADLQRQQAKTVAALNKLNASVVGLMEIENSAKLGEGTDEATRTLVQALNTAAGRTKWAYVPSSTQLQPLADQDVITNALIYQPGRVRLQGSAYADGAESVDGGAFGNARTPIAAAFTPKKGGQPTLVSVNHFKSKGSAPSDPADPNADRGQGAWNVARVAQAKALLGWLPGVQKASGADAVALVGDFNSYTQEDPLRTLYAAGYANAVSPSDYSYSFSGLVGSLDHVLLNRVAAQGKKGSGVWNINSVESDLLEYSTYKTTAIDYYRADPYRSSDHDPVIVGLKVAKATSTELTFLNFNDFHGRIALSSPDTVAFFGTIEQERAAAGEKNTLLLSAGDNIGASLFPSAVAQDQPTIDVLNAVDLDASAVGNHEFDKGFSDLTGRVERAADWTYLGANVDKKGTTTPAMQTYRVIKRDGLRIGIIGAVTQETPSLVSPDATATLDFGDPVDAVNRVARQLTDGRSTNGEADVLIAEYHEGAGAGSSTSTLQHQVGAGGAFAKIVTKTSPKVAAIFTAHTHMAYAWDAPVPGSSTATRPVLQSASYASLVGKVTLRVDKKSHRVVAHTATNLAVTTTPDAELVARYPRVARISAIVNDAVAQSKVVGAVKIGESTGELSRAFIGSSEDRGGESTLSNLVAEMYRQQTSSPDRGAAQIGVQNPGGVRADVDKGDITYEKAASVLPFANSVFTVDLTGAQFKQVLEQQWQTTANGTPIEGSRSYLQLGLSDNVTYTFDASRARGDRITSVAVDGLPIEAGTTYRVATNSFLATGGDNFRAFGTGADIRDRGLSDLEAWVDFIKAQAPVSPSFAKHAVSVVPAPGTLTAGGPTSFTVSRLDFASKSGGDPRTSTLTAILNGEKLGTFPVSGGAAEVTLEVSDDAASGPGLLELTTDTGTIVTLPVTVG